jgi:undecaprenyl diphosphate synthase
VPTHMAVIMDGIDRWYAPDVSSPDANVVAGLNAIQAIIDACIARGIKFLTLLDFSSDVSVQTTPLLRAFLQSNMGTVLNEHAVRFQFAGDASQLAASIQDQIASLRVKTERGEKLVLTFCAHYDGQWDIVQALNRLRREPGFTLPITEEQLTPFLAMAHTPEPDLLIRTGGKTELSKFMTWQLAYSELYFTDTLWPDFDAAAFDLAISSYQTRERRFGRTSAQVVGQSS